MVVVNNKYWVNVWALALVMAAVSSYSAAFMMGSSRSLSRISVQQNNNNLIASKTPQIKSTVCINASGEDAAEEEESASSDAVATEGEENSQDEAEEEGEEEEEEPKEDPEVMALKEEIAELEDALKSKRRQLRETQDTADRYTKTGYARKVAEMENMRRARSMLQSSDKSSASATILREFLPVIEQLESLKEKYADDEFGKQYGALPGALKGAFTSLGVTDYTVTMGEKIDLSRMVVVESEHCEDQPADTVLRPLKMGLELQGNIVQYAECVASLGPEKTEEAAEEAEEAAADEPVDEERDIE